MLSYGGGDCGDNQDHFSENGSIYPIDNGNDILSYTCKDISIAIKLFFEASLLKNRNLFKINTFAFFYDNSAKLQLSLNLTNDFGDLKQIFAPLETN